MTPNAIAKLRRTFIAVAMASFIVVIAFMGVAVSIGHVLAITADASMTIDAIIDADGDTPGADNFPDGMIREEASFGLRFFTISFDEQDEITDIDLRHIASVTQEEAREAARIASGPALLTSVGRSGNFLFKEGATDTGSMLVFLDCTVQIENARATIGNTLAICLVAVLVTFICVFFFSRRAIMPEVENARQQQQFMTNAGHELKTPIAVIRANTELTEMISGETEWTQSTLRQVDRLERLVGDLMAIVRREERGDEGDAVGSTGAANGETAGSGSLPAFDASQVVASAVDSFNAVALQNGIALESAVSPGVILHGKPASIEQLTCLLTDNAIKYCDAGGSVKVSLAKARVGKGCVLAVSNDFAAGADVDYRRFFERFYREDESHENQQGYGIGLSVAESICKRYKGAIKATWKAGVITFTCTLKGA